MARWVPLPGIETWQYASGHESQVEKDMKRLRPIKVRWGRTLLMALALVLVVGECSPAATALTALP